MLYNTIINMVYNSVIAGCVKATCLSTNKFHITAIHRVDFPTGAEVGVLLFLMWAGPRLGNRLTTHK